MGIDIETLIDVYPSLNEEYILNLISSQSAKGKGKANKRKKNRKKNRNKNKNFDADGNDDGNDGNDKEFEAQFKSFKKKADFINKQKEQLEDGIDGNENDG